VGADRELGRRSWIAENWQPVVATAMVAGWLVWSGTAPLASSPPHPAEDAWKARSSTVLAMTPATEAPSPSVLHRAPVLAEEGKTRSSLPTPRAVRPPAASESYPSGAPPRASGFPAGTPVSLPFDSAATYDEVTGRLLVESCQAMEVWQAETGLRLSDIRRHRAFACGPVS
jgi:hypothetical protein